MSLPHLTNGKHNFQNVPVPESYREKIKEKIQNTPRRNMDYSKSIDLTINNTSDNNSFRSSSRQRTQTRLSDAENDINFNQTPRQNIKSGRNRQIIYYNNNSNNNNNNNNNNVDSNNFDTNIKFGKSDHSINFNNNQRDNLDNNIYLNQGNMNSKNSHETNDKINLSRRKRQDSNDVNIIDDSNSNNNNNNINYSENFRERMQTARENMKTPLLTPRKTLQIDESNSPKARLKSSNISRSLTIGNHNDIDSFKESNNNDEFFNATARLNSSRRSNDKINSSLITFSPNDSIKNFELTLSKTDLRNNNEPPIPAPRKSFTNYSTKLLNNEINDFHIKRASSGIPNRLLTPRTYAPSSRSSNQPEREFEQQQEPHLSNLSNKQYNNQNRRTNYKNLEFENETESFNNTINRDSNQSNSRRNSFGLGIETKFETRILNRSNRQN